MKPGQPTSGPVVLRGRNPRRLLDPGRVAKSFPASFDRLTELARRKDDLVDHEATASRPWFWEGTVQAAVVRVADTRTHRTGKEIEAERDGTALWITVKGYPTGTARTAAPTQARR